MKQLLAILLILVGVFFLLAKGIKNVPLEDQLSLKIESVIMEGKKPTGLEKEATSFIRTVEGGQFFTEKQAQYALKMRYPGELYYRACVWNFEKGKTVAITAPDTKGNHHFTNAYLVGYEPFKTKHLWVPLYVIAERMQYLPDKLKGMGLVDLWQTSKQAFWRGRGDCEDHAVALADWLIEMGEDARVVMGTHKGGDHAWVVLFKESGEYVIEATDKRRYNDWTYYPRAEFATDYQPKFMFTRDDFWANAGNPFTVKYSGKSWELRSNYSRESLFKWESIPTG